MYIRISNEKERKEERRSIYIVCESRKDGHRISQCSPAGLLEREEADLEEAPPAANRDEEADIVLFGDEQFYGGPADGSIAIYTAFPVLNNKGWANYIKCYYTLLFFSLRCNYNFE